MTQGFIGVFSKKLGPLMGLRKRVPTFALYLPVTLGAVRRKRVPTSAAKDFCKARKMPATRDSPFYGRLVEAKQGVPIPFCF